MPSLSRTTLWGLAVALLACWCVGMFARGFWTPDEPREADIAWRMSWQPDKAVPLLAGEAFCEKPPFTYWAAALPIRLFGAAPWAARLPNLFYALASALAVAGLCRRIVGIGAGLMGAALFSTFLLSYQVAIWLATDAPLVAADAVALLGLYRGFYAADRAERWRGYLIMHCALGLGFLCKSAAAWMVPALTLGTLVIWERRWRELLRLELYAGLLVQAVLVLSWVWFVYTGPDGVAHLKVFFWNNLVGRFTKVDAPAEVQYAAAHRNSPGKYLIEMPVYLFPWTLVTVAALRHAWKARTGTLDAARAPRFAMAVTLPSLLVLSVAATARNIYFAPALPGLALLLCWWVSMPVQHDRWDRRALRATAVLLIVATLVMLAAGILVGIDGWESMQHRVAFSVALLAGSAAAAACAVRAWHPDAARSQRSLMLAFLVLLAGPTLSVYTQVDGWQDLASIARAAGRDADSRPLALLHPDETTRAMIDMYARTEVTLAADVSQVPPGAVLLQQLPGRAPPRSAMIARWIHKSGGTRDEVRGALIREYQLPNGRRYALSDPGR